MSDEPDYEVVTGGSEIKAPNKGRFVKGDPRIRPGKKGKSGRRKDVVRERLIADFEKVAPMLLETALDKQQEMKDRLNAANLIGRYGIGTQQDQDIVERRSLIVGDEPTENGKEAE